MDTIELASKPHNRNMGAYTTIELRTLANLKYEEFIKDDYSNKDVETVRLMDTLYSLERFDLAGHCSIRVNGTYAGWAWTITDKGLNELNHRKPNRYGCQCEYAIRLPCVCAEKTYCPNPEHKGNGCHGTHD